MAEGCGELLDVHSSTPFTAENGSPDGKRIVYTVADLDRRPFKTELFVMNSRGLNSFQMPRFERHNCWLQLVPRR